MNRRPRKLERQFQVPLSFLHWMRGSMTRVCGGDPDLMTFACASIVWNLGLRATRRHSALVTKPEQFGVSRRTWSRHKGSVAVVVQTLTALGDAYQADVANGGTGDYGSLYGADLRVRSRTRMFPGVLPAARSDDKSTLVRGGMNVRFHPELRGTNGGRHLRWYAALPCSFERAVAVARTVPGFSVWMVLWVALAAQAYLLEFRHPPTRLNLAWATGHVHDGHVVKRSWVHRAVTAMTAAGLTERSDSGGYTVVENAWRGPFRMTATNKTLQLV